MPPIEFPSGTAPGARPQEGAGRLVNAYAEPLGADSGIVIRRAPGIRRWGQSSQQEGYRGSILVATDLFTAFRDRLVIFNSYGEDRQAGPLIGSGKVFFARNNHIPPQVVAVTEVGAYAFVHETGVFGDYPDPDLPAVTGVTFLDGYFFFWTPDGRMLASAVNGQAINATNIATLESSPDGCKRLVPWEGQLIGFGDVSAEVWSGSPPNLTGFPFNRVAVIGRGLISPWAVTGFEEGFKKGLFWVGDDNGVHMLAGYEAQRVSTDDLDRLIEAIADKSTIEMFCYIAGGHSCVVVKSPDWCWVFDLGTQKWHERQSYLQPTWRVRGNSIFAFGLWIVGDDGPRLYAIEHGLYREAEDPLVFMSESKGSRAFPRPVRVDAAHFGLEPGVSDESNDDRDAVQRARADISWSDDGGMTWSHPVERELGRQGRYNQRLSVFRTGTAGYWGRRWKVEVSDPVYVGLLGGTMDVGV